MANTIEPKEQFINEMESLVDKLKVIDKNTPWQETEPKWWLDMMDVQTKAREVINKYKK